MQVWTKWKKGRKEGSRGREKHVYGSLEGRKELLRKHEEETSVSLACGKSKRPVELRYRDNLTLTKKPSSIVCLEENFIFLCVSSKLWVTQLLCFNHLKIPVECPLKIHTCTLNKNEPDKDIY